MKCKILWINKKPEVVETEINRWLSEHPKINIKAMTVQPNFCYTIIYEE